MPVVGGEMDLYHERADALREGSYAYDGAHPVGYDALLAAAGELRGGESFGAAPWLGALAVFVGACVLAIGMASLWRGRRNGVEGACWSALAGAALLANGAVAALAAQAISDVVFSTVCGGSVALWLRYPRPGVKAGFAMGLLAGLSWSIRVTGMVNILLFALPAILFVRRGRMIGAVCGGVVAGALPQLIVGAVFQGNPFYNESGYNLAWKTLHGFGELSHHPNLLPGAVSILQEHPWEVVQGALTDLWAALTHGLPQLLQGGGMPIEGYLLLGLAGFGAARLASRRPRLGWLLLGWFAVQLAAVVLMIKPWIRLLIPMLPVLLVWILMGLIVIRDRNRSLAFVLAATSLLALPALRFPAQLTALDARQAKGLHAAMVALASMERPLLVAGATNVGASGFPGGRFEVLPTALWVPAMKGGAQGLEETRARVVAWAHARGYRDLLLMEGDVPPRLFGTLPETARKIGWSAEMFVPGVLRVTLPLPLGWEWIDELVPEPGGGNRWELRLDPDHRDRIRRVGCWVRIGTDPPGPMFAREAANGRFLLELDHLMDRPSISAGGPPVWIQPAVQIDGGALLPGAVHRVR